MEIPETWKLVAQSEDSQFLIQTDGDFGRILDSESGILFPETNMVSSRDFVPWQRCEGSEDRLRELVAAVREVRERSPEAQADWEQQKRQYKEATAKA